MAEERPAPDCPAFRSLDEFFFIPADEGSPDEAFDWIHMMHDDDWRLLEGAWSNRPAGWRESCVYILGFGPVPNSLPLLRIALFDTSVDVASEAACSIAAQRLNHGGVVELGDAEIARMRELAATSSHLEEVTQVLASLSRQ